MFWINLIYPYGCNTGCASSSLNATGKWEQWPLKWVQKCLEYTIRYSSDIQVKDFISKDFIDHRYILQKYKTLYPELEYIKVFCFFTYKEVNKRSCPPPLRLTAI